MSKKRLFIICLLFISGCGGSKKTTFHANNPCIQRDDPTWRRLFFGVAENELPGKLIGVRLQQRPDCMDEREKYEVDGAHPCMGCYVFKRDEEYKVCQVGFEPDGKISSMFWWDQVPKEGDWILDNLIKNIPGKSNQADYAFNP